MKRTAKWQKHLTLAEVRHLKEMNSLSLPKFRQNRAAQKSQKAKLIELNGDEERGILTEPCWECRHIESKLKKANVL